MLLLGSVLFVVLVGSFDSVTSDLKNIKAEPGDDVTLTCEDKTINRIFLLGWSRNDLQEEETVFLYRSDAGLLDQHESFRNRVFLKDSQMKDGDLSVVLKNVKTEDTGTYECRVRHENDPQIVWSLISIIRLSVDPPGDEGLGGGDEDGYSLSSPGRINPPVVAAVAAVLIVVLLLIFFLINKRLKPNFRFDAVGIIYPSSSLSPPDLDLNLFSSTDNSLQKDTDPDQHCLQTLQLRGLKKSVKPDRCSTSQQKKENQPWSHHGLSTER